MTESVSWRGYDDETVSFLRLMLERQPGAQAPHVPEFVVSHAIDKIERLHAISENLYHVAMFLYYRYMEATGMEGQVGESVAIYPGITKNRHMVIDPLFEIDIDIVREELRNHLWRKVSGDPSGMGQAVLAQDEILRDLELGLNHDG